MDTPKPLGDVLHHVIENLGIRRGLDEARTIESWAAVAGPQINGVTEKAWVRRRKLYVKVTSSAWRHELHLQRQAWCSRLNDHLGGELVEEIIFR